jgi:hypothetical protein
MTMGIAPGDLVFAATFSTLYVGQYVGTVDVDRGSTTAEVVHVIDATHFKHKASTRDWVQYGPETTNMKSVIPLSIRPITRQAPSDSLPTGFFISPSTS